MVDYKHAISIRHSSRSFLPQELGEDIVDRLKASIAEYNSLSGLNIQLILNDGTPFGGLSKSYGMFSGVNNYIVMAGAANGVHEKEKVGYYGEKLVLEATEYGLGTCWVGGTFDKTACKCSLEAKESIFCVIAIGHTAVKKGLKDKLISNVMSSKKKPLESFYDTGNLPAGSVPHWFMEGIKAVQLAPSAMNRQPVKFTYNSNTADPDEDSLPSVSIWLESNTKGFEQIDMGIAKLHFEIGATEGEWEWE